MKALLIIIFVVTFAIGFYMEGREPFSDSLTCLISGWFYVFSLLFSGLIIGAILSL